jgi:predicted ArsR family transcriptional regulator
LRASCAEAPIQTAATASTPTPSPRNSTRSFSRTPDSSLARDSLARQRDDHAAIEEVVDLLDQQGFEPSAQECEIHMARCPFHALAESQPEVVCAVHKGLITGALSALGSDLEVEGLDVFVRPDLCVARLARR